MNLSNLTIHRAHSNTLINLKPHFGFPSYSFFRKSINILKSSQVSGTITHPNAGVLSVMDACYQLLLPCADEFEALKCIFNLKELTLGYSFRRQS